MGLIKATTGSIGSVVGDQFKEFITCPQMGDDILLARGVVSHGEGNTKPSEGVITNGSKIVVPDGTAMMIIDNGAIKEFSAEAGEFIWDSSTEPSVFEGGFFKGIGDSIKKIGDRITFGGQTARDQRVYYINLLLIKDNKFGSTNSETVYDPIYGSVEITFHGQYSFKVDNPVFLVNELLGANAKDEVTVEEVVGDQLKMEFASNMSTCISDLMIDKNVSFVEIQRYKNEITEKMNELLAPTWQESYGLKIMNIALNINGSDETKEIIRSASKGKVFSNNPTGMMGAATAEAMVGAANNGNGAMMGFAGLNMAQNAGANMMNAVSNQAPATGVVGGVVTEGNQGDKKFCTNCGKEVNGKFCANCGTEVK